jgi:hypothetical protein
LQFENEAVFDYEADLVNEMVNNVGKTMALATEQTF